MKRLFFLLFSTSLFASINEPLSIELGTGYREDRLKLRIHLPGSPSSIIYEEKYNHLRFIQSEMTLQKIHRDMFFYANGAFGALGSGGSIQGQIPLKFSSDQLRFKYDTSAIAGNVLGSFGYFVDLTPGRYYQVALAPLFGYCYYYEKVERKNPSPNPQTGSTFNPQESYSVSSSFTNKDLTTEWNGFFVGVNLVAKPASNTTFDVFYAYHFLEFRQRVNSQFHTEIFTDPMALISKTIETNKANIKTGGNHGHLGWVKSAYAFTQRVSLSLMGKIFYFSTRVRGITNVRTTKKIIPVAGTTTIHQDRKFKFRHTSFNILLFLELKI